MNSRPGSRWREVERRSLDHDLLGNPLYDARIRHFLQVKLLLIASAIVAGAAAIYASF